MIDIYNMLFKLYKSYFDKNIVMGCVWKEVYNRLVVTDKVFVKIVTEYQNKFGKFENNNEKSVFTYVYFLDKMQKGV